MENICVDACATSRNIKKLCQQKSITPAMLQKELGDVTLQATYSWMRESGKLPSIDNLVRISYVLGVSLDDLVIVKRY
ncbi:MAG: helix-turn-helix transcriptional regulator [Lachnospiraceae bacterium]|nr:helix-turn-helix transcriptional regulator [Lachnospiraceae bacterium]MBR3599368.1 helix-turn-helix transcriptional regulator [Lachnospiraceae bacterium]